MHQPVSQDPFPVGFPPELVSTAFVALYEAAWRPTLAVRSVEWLGMHGYAVLGTEIWLPKGGSIQTLPYFQNVNRNSGEEWESDWPPTRYENLGEQLSSVPRSSGLRLQLYGVETFLLFPQGQSNGRDLPG